MSFPHFLCRFNQSPSLLFDKNYPQCPSCGRNTTDHKLMDSNSCITFQRSFESLDTPIPHSSNSSSTASTHDTSKCTSTSHSTNNSPNCHKKPHNPSVSKWDQSAQSYSNLEQMNTPSLSIHFFLLIKSKSYSIFCPYGSSTSKSTSTIHPLKPCASALLNHFYKEIKIVVYELFLNQMLGWIRNHIFSEIMSYSY